MKCKLMIAKAGRIIDAPDEIDAGNCIPWKGSRWNSEYKCSEQTDELENGNHQISRGKFDPVQYGD